MDAPWIISVSWELAQSDWPCIEVTWSSGIYDGSLAEIYGRWKDRCLLDNLQRLVAIDFC